MNTVLEGKKVQVPERPLLPDRHGRGPWAIVIAAIVLLAAGLGTWAYVAKDSGRPAAVRAVAAHVDALKKHDLVALQASVTTDSLWVATDHGAAVAAVQQGPQYLQFYKGLFATGFSIEVVGAPLKVTDNQVVDVTRLPLYNRTGITIFNLRDVNGQLKVAETIWMPDTAQPATDKTAATKVVNDYIKAANAGDLTAMQKTMTTDSAWIASQHGQVAASFTGFELTRNEQSDINNGFHLNIVGSPLVATNTQVAVGSHVTTTGFDQTATSVFILRSVNGELKIAEIIWTGPTS